MKICPWNILRFFSDIKIENVIGKQKCDIFIIFAENIANGVHTSYVFDQK